jgi:hypothetical protein
MVIGNGTVAVCLVYLYLILTFYWKTKHVLGLGQHCAPVRWGLGLCLGHLYLTKTTALADAMTNYPPHPNSSIAVIISWADPCSNTGAVPPEKNFPMNIFIIMYIFRKKIQNIFILLSKKKFNFYFLWPKSGSTLIIIFEENPLHLFEQ